MNRRRSPHGSRQRLSRVEALEKRYFLAGEILLQNGGFEAPTLGAWQGFGPQAQVQLVNSPVHTGTKAALVTGRAASFEGIAQALPSLAADQDYEISVWVRLRGSSPSVVSEDRLELQVTVQDVQGVRFVSVDEQIVRSNAWTQLKGGFRLDANTPATTVQLDIGNAKPGTEYYVDSGEIRAIDWRTAADQRIEQYRKRDAVVHVTDANGDPLTATSIQVRQLTNEFGFGAALNEFALDNPEYAEFFSENFDWATTENAYKWRFTEPQRDTENYANADRVTRFAKDNQIQLRGHNVLWGTDAGVPDWVRNPDGASALPNAELREEVNEHVTSLVNRYRQDVAHWEVHNESLDLPFFQQLETTPTSDIDADLLRQVRAIDTDATLFTNEFGIIEGAAHRSAEYRALIQRLKTAAAPIGGIGVEAHFERGISPTAILHGLDPLDDLGLPIWLTEFDVVNGNVLDRARDLEVFYRTAFSIPQVQGVILWGFWENAHWRGPNAALVNADWTLNAAGERYQSLMDEWTTEAQGSGQQLAFRGYHGTYEVSVQLPNGLIHRQTFSLGSNVSAAFQFAVQVPWVDPATIVTSAADSGPGSLRNAIQYINATPGRQTITFRIPGTAPYIISPLTPLPTLVGSAGIDGTKVPGFVKNPLVVIDGSKITTGAADGLVLAGNAGAIRGLSIVGFRGDGIEIAGHQNEITQNFIGVLPTSAVRQNLGNGIHVRSGTLNQIGRPNAGNVLSGNAQSGILIAALASSNRAESNYVGIDSLGLRAVSNGVYGIQVLGTGNTIGGSASNQGNVVSGNLVSGIVVWGTTAKSNTLQFNRVGTNFAGTIAIPNRYYGVEFQAGAATNQLLDSQISGNGDGGVLIQGITTTGNRVDRNRIGVDFSGTRVLANRTYGVSILSPRNQVTGNTIGGHMHGIRIGTNAVGNQIRSNAIGTDAVAGSRNLANQMGIYLQGTATQNVIAENQIAFNGVGIQAEPTTTANAFTRNAISRNTGLGIDLNGDGITANDAGDIDTGANRLQNSPDLIEARVIATKTLLVRYRVDSLNAQSSFPLTIEFFVDDGFGEGKVFLTQDSYSLANALQGVKSIQLTFTASIPATGRIVATATDVRGNTSEFSVARTYGTVLSANGSIANSIGSAGLSAIARGSKTSTGTTQENDLAITQMFGTMA